MGEGYRYLDHTQTKVDGLFTDGQSFMVQWTLLVIRSIGQGPKFTRIFVLGRSLITSKEYLASQNSI